MKKYQSIDEVLGPISNVLLTSEEEQLLLAAIKEKGVECEEMESALPINTSTKGLT